ncbi:hypothetical protein BH11BAC1_BH11BAC1_13790 [soil metagenome]
MKSLLYFLKPFIILLITLIILSRESVKAQVVIDTFNLPSVNFQADLKFKNALNIDQQNHVWIGFKKIGAGMFDGSTWTVYDTSSGLPSNNVLSFAFEGNNVWMGTDSGLAKYDGNSFTIFDSLNSSLTSNYILSLFADGSDIWIGTHDGVFLFDGTNWTHFDSGNSPLPADTINCFARNGNDTVWMGTPNGIAGFHNGTWKIHTNFYPGISRIPVFNLKIDADENLWIESYEQQLFILKDDSLYRPEQFFSFCSINLSQGSLIGLNNSGQMVYMYNGMSEAKLLPSSYSSFSDYTFPGLFSTSGSRLGVAALDQNNKLWYARIFNGSYVSLFSVDFESALTALIPGDDCDEFLDVNSVSARIHPNGTLFWDQVGTSQYEVPKGSGLHSIFADELWIGGLDPGNNLHMAAQMYRQSGNDFWPGPLDTTNATVDSATVAQYTRLWKIDRYTITIFKNEFAAGNVTNLTYPVPDIILNWPASGTGNYSRDLAPYVDVNNDGVYNPYDGDYPDMKGDQMIWCVFNDNYLIHRETEGVALGIEIQLSAYAYRCNVAPDTEQVVNYSTFYHYRIINRSDTDYTQVYMGRDTDVDLGNYVDDFVGCDSALGIAFAYNGDNFDEGIAGYGVNPPMQNILYLNQPFTDFMYFYGTSDPQAGYPASDDDFYSYMRSRWRNEVHLTYGEFGYQGTDSVNYMYSSNPYDTSAGAWNETTSGNTPDDRRFLTSTGPFIFPAHSEKEFDVAYVWTRDETQPNGLNSSWAKNVHDIMKIKEWYARDSFPCSQFVGIAENNFEQSNLELYPNPASNGITLFAGSKISTTFLMTISDVTGREILSRQIISNHKTQVSIGEFSPGIYFVKIRNNEMFATKKFIKE